MESPPSPLSPTSFPSHHQLQEHLLTRDRRLRLMPALVQDIDYIVERTYHLAPYLGPFWGLPNALATHIGFYTIIGTWRSTHVIFHLVKKAISFAQNDPKRI